MTALSTGPAAQVSSGIAAWTRPGAAAEADPSRPVLSPFIPNGPVVTHPGRMSPRSRAAPAASRAYRVRVVRYRVVITGRVQGVFFRDTCRRVAERHGVSGWVRNLPDGSVEAVFEGPVGEVRRLVEGSRHGPRSAAVQDIRVRAEPPEGISGFRIR